MQIICFRQGGPSTVSDGESGLTRQIKKLTSKSRQQTGPGISPNSTPGSLGEDSDDSHEENLTESLRERREGGPRPDGNSGDTRADEAPHGAAAAEVTASDSKGSTATPRRSESGPDPGPTVRSDGPSARPGVQV